MVAAAVAQRDRAADRRCDRTDRSSSNNKDHRNADRLAEAAISALNSSSSNPDSSALNRDGPVVLLLVAICSSKRFRRLLDSFSSPLLLLCHIHHRRHLSSMAMSLPLLLVTLDISIIDPIDMTRVLDTQARSNKVQVKCADHHRHNTRRTRTPTTTAEAT